MKALSRLVLSSLTLLILASSAADSAGAQQRSRVPVIVALVTDMPVPDAPFVILRRPDILPHDVILLPVNGANPRMLSDAVRALLLARQHSGDRPLAPATLRMRPNAERDAGNRGLLGWTVQVIQDLRRADPMPIEGVGRVPTVQIWLPRQDTQ